MPFALLTIGLMILVTALNNTWPQFGKQVYQDIFTESGGFLYWVAALVIVGFIGYIPSLRKPADTFIVLILVAMILKNGGFFSQLQSALAGGATGATGSSGGSTGGSTTSSSSGNIFNFPSLNLAGLSAIQGNEPLTTPAPAAPGQSVPLGFGGIGSA
jgi:hypothetical protein